MDYGDWRLGPPQLDPQVQATIKALRAPNAVIPKENGFWKKTWPGAESVTIHVIDNNPYAGNALFENLGGWTICDKEKRTCQIMLLRNAPNRDCVEAHERRHAGGYDHPGYLASFDCSD